MQAPARVTWNVVLFLLTCLSTLLAGTGFGGSPTFDDFRSYAFPMWMLSGVPFAVTLLGILGVHEFGHYFTARHYRASVSLPYFIPAPPPLFLAGTLGAIIQMRSPARDRNSLFDIAVAGPLAGLAVAVPAILFGLAWSTVVPAPPRGHVIEFGTSLLMRALMYLRFGQIPEGMMVFTHPIADAAWFGFLVTALNLFPVGQLDGGHISYAVLGRRSTYVTIAMIGVAIVLSYRSASWIVWTVVVTGMLVAFGVRHPPVLDEDVQLDPARRVLAVVAAIIFALCFTPAPIQELFTR